MAVKWILHQWRSWYVRNSWNAFVSDAPKRHFYQVKRLARKDAKMKEGWQCRHEVPTPVHRDIMDFDGVCYVLVNCVYVKIEYTVFYIMQKLNLGSFRNIYWANMVQIWKDTLKFVTSTDIPVLGYWCEIKKIEFLP